MKFFLYSLIGLFILIWLSPVECLSAEPTQPTHREKELYFEQHVRPLLIKHCQECHGAKKQFAELRLDSRPALLKGGESGPAVKVNHPENSLLMSAVRRESLEMPPDNSLTPGEIEILSVWIRQGAVWPQSADSKQPTTIDYTKHWSFQPIQDPAIPPVKNKDWPHNNIDYFILSRLEKAGLQPAPTAISAVLLKRIFWDLTGLLPTQEQIQSFTSNDQKSMVDSAVTAQLASLHYGERWGRHWLDLARYADTKGYVFFEKPAFHFAYTYRDYVINSLNQDKPFDQFIREQLAADYLKEELPHESQAALGFITLGPRFKNDIHDIISDRIDVVTRGFLGLTVGCARCHNHKYDPVSTEDYYSLYGVFRNSLVPLDLPFRKQNHLSSELQEQAVKMQSAARELNNLYEGQHQKVLQDTSERLAEYLIVAQSRRQGPDTVKFDVIVDGDDLNPEVLLLWQEFLDITEKSADPVFSIWQKLDSIPEQMFASQAADVLERIIAASNPDSVQSLLASHLLKKNPRQFNDIIRGYATLFHEIDHDWAHRIVVARKPEQKQNQQPFPIARRQYLDSFYSPHSPLTIPLHGYTVLKLFPDRKLQEKVKALNAALDQARAQAPIELAQMMTLRDADQIIEPRVFKRGNPGSPGQPVTRKYLSYFEQVSDEQFQQGSGRLELANAISSSRNPLTARVIVNRVWQHHFGQGIVSTPSDFGIQGARPSHPELLDHLATWFIQNGWSIKKLHRYIMQSATYQQSSISHETGEKLDPANKLLWRMNRRRQDFESMRDTLLQVSHQLDSTVGGKSVSGITSDSNRRRTLYTFINRQEVPGLLRTFDFPSPDVSTGTRNSTSVPGQSLFLMNHPLVLKSAFILGNESEQAETPTAGIQHLYRSILQRDPTQSEISEMLEFVAKDQIKLKTEPTRSEWEYGYASYDLITKTLSDFQPLLHWNGKQYQGGDRLPDSKIGWVFLDQTGGHPGNDLDHVAVIRWRAPDEITVSLTGVLKHELPQGNGIRGRVLVNNQLALGPWTLHENTAKTDIKSIKLKKNQTIDFVVDIAGHLGFDSFIWSLDITANSPELTTVSKSEPQPPLVRQWNYSKDFRKPAPVPVTSWQSLAQILLLSNEFQFID
ncbi:PSD1 and planctomycete cytochrome C domain-containing protein [Gimesia algae]|uniref:Planctomycete cytochrome C n=1 Tax=Gimesia algae TaxID=2527971 RepID=A0A517VBL2_9PLAN|nr:PSD1 and planctomycete cytochrome C domain-containing protein [Gimesia algae]QDT90394.1 Planctomycete cytochrome C [Gimesia algae]